MRLKKWIFLFWSTLLIGAISALLVGMLLVSIDKEFEFIGVSGIGFNLYTMVLGGLMFSVVSQMGFFAYLMLQYIAVGIFRRKLLWEVLQICLIIIVLFDFAYFGLFPFNEVIFPIAIVVGATLVAYWKVRMTNWSAFIPTLFFMTVVTVAEAFPALKLDNQASAIFMTIPLFLCNTWQILMLHRLLSPKKLA